LTQARNRRRRPVPRVRARARRVSSGRTKKIGRGRLIATTPRRPRRKRSRSARRRSTPAPIAGFRTGSIGGTPMRGRATAAT